MSKAIDMGNLERSERDTAEDREIKERAGMGKVDGRTLRKTGRSEQMMLRTTPAVRKDVERLAAANGWSFSETMERAIEALKREMKGRT